MEEMDPVVNEVDVGEVTIDQPRWYEGHISLEDAKTFIKANITTAARSFIAIGFYLKCVRDRELFTEDGFQNIWDFAKEEYGISKSTASRYMSMNDRFSEKGNSPNIREEYRAFGKSQLQEMLYLEDDQLDQIKPGDRVEDIRSLRKPKEVPYIELPGQLEFKIDFPDILPDQPIHSTISQKQTFEMSVEDMLSGEEQDGIAISQQEQVGELTEGKDQEIEHFWDRNESIDDAYGWFRSELVKEYLKSGYKGADEECEIMVLGSAHRVVKAKEVTVFHDISGTATFDVENTRLEREYNYFFGNHDLTEIESKEPENVPEQPESVPVYPENIINGEFVEVLPEKELSARIILEEEKAELHNWIEAFKGEGKELPPAVERRRIIVAALAAMVCELEAVEPELVKPEQPELPILKNNEQRAAFIDAYDTWPIWIETKETGERYYRYDLTDKVSMVIKVNWKHSWASYKESKDYEYGAEQYYLLGVKSEWRNGKSAYVEDDTRTFYECNTNRSALVEYLKEFQKKKEG